MCCRARTGAGLAVAFAALACGCGGDHGVELFDGRHAPQVRAAILRFVRSL